MKWRFLFKLLTHLILFTFLMFSAFHYKISLYLLYQAKGQFLILANTESFYDFKKKHHLSPQQKSNLELIEKIKTYSVDSLGFTPTKNYTSIYDQGAKPLLWLITACEPFRFKAYHWYFPIVGNVSYKGFFKKELAQTEYNYLLEKGYDVELRTVSAWSTLGWFNDPVFSGMLDRPKGSLCHLIFHELFHATYYAPGTVNFNENLAEFIAHKATLRFLKKDSIALNNYLQEQQDSEWINQYMLQNKQGLSSYYEQIKNRPDRNHLKQARLKNIADSLSLLPLKNKKRIAKRGEEILRFKNAYFVGFMQYSSLQDSLEEVFNKIYRANIEKLVQDLKLN